MASRRRRRKSIGKVIVDVERRVRRVEKRPGAKRLKTNVVTTEKLGYRAVTTKTVAPDAITPNEAAFGTPVVSETEPTNYLKEGSSWFNPDTGEQKIYDPTTDNFIDLAAVDLTARASADGKNTIYRQNSQPSGGTYVTGDTWFDTDDDNKIYRYDGTSWVGFTLGNNALASISANKITAGTIDASVIRVSNLDAGEITTGSLSASRITTGTISASISITSATITGSTITGGTVRTASAATTPRIELTSTSANNMLFYGSATAPGAISVSSHTIYLYAPGSAIGAGANMQIYGDQSATTPNGIFMSAGASGVLNFSMSSTSVFLTQGTYGLRINTGGVIAVGGAGESTEAMRNIRITQTAPTSGASSGTDNGTIVLVREA